MQNLVATVHDSEMLLICGDLIGHNGKESLSYEGIHGRYGFENWNVDGERILEFVVANNLFLGQFKSYWERQSPYHIPIWQFFKPNRLYITSAWQI